MNDRAIGSWPAPSFGRAFTLLATAELAAVARNRRSLLWITAVPVAILVLDMSQVSGRVPAPEVWSFVAWAIVMGAFVLGLLGYSTDLVGYRERGVFRRLRTTPVPAGLILVVRGMAALLAILAEFLVVLTVAVLAYHVHPTAATVAGGLGAVALGGLSAVALAQLIVARTARAQSATALARLALIVSFFLNGTFIRVQVWPRFWQHVAEWTPVRLAGAVLVSTLQGQPWGPTTWHDAAGLAAWIAVTGVVGVAAFRWEGGDR